MKTDQSWIVMRERVLQQEAWIMSLPSNLVCSAPAGHWRRENGIAPWREDFAGESVDSPGGSPVILGRGLSFVTLTPYNV